MSKIIAQPVGQPDRKRKADQGSAKDTEKVVSKKLAPAPAPACACACASSLTGHPNSTARDLLFDYNIDPYDKSDEELIDAAMVFLSKFHLFTEFSFDEQSARNFMHKVRTLYNPENSFHNFKHVWGVMHVCFHLLVNGGAEHLMPLDILAVWISALCHDVQHPGNNNAFEEATASDLSRSNVGLHPTAGILELHHAMQTSKLLFASGTEYEIMKHLSDADKEHLARQVGLIILATDMAKHQHILEEARAYTNRRITRRSLKQSLSTCSLISSSGGDSPNKVGRSGVRTVSGDGGDATACTAINFTDVNPVVKGLVQKDDPESRIAFTRVLVHTADIGAQTQGSATARKWMERCYGEFRNQANKEKKLGIMTSPFLHDLQEDWKAFSAQYYFIQDTVEPLWTAMSMFLPGMQFATDQLIENKVGYKTTLEDCLRKQ